MSQSINHKPYKPVIRESINYEYSFDYHYLCLSIFYLPFSSKISVIKCIQYKTFIVTFKLRGSLGEYYKSVVYAKEKQRGFHERASNGTNI